MKNLASQDIQSLSEAIQHVYTLQDPSTFGVEILTVIDRLVPSDLPEFHLTESRSHQISASFLPGCSDYTPALRQIAQRHFGEHPIVQNMPHTLNGVHKVSDFVSPTALHQLEGYYQQFLKVLNCEDQMVFFLPETQPQTWHLLVRENAKLAGIALNRSQRNFTERDRQILNLLRPHLIQAYSNAQRYHQLQQQYTQQVDLKLVSTNFG